MSNKLPSIAYYQLLHNYGKLLTRRQKVNMTMIIFTVNLRWLQELKSTLRLELAYYINIYRLSSGLFKLSLGPTVQTKPSSLFGDCLRFGGCRLFQNGGLEVLLQRRLCMSPKLVVYVSDCSSGSMI